MTTTNIIPSIAALAGLMVGLTRTPTNVPLVTASSTTYDATLR